MKKSTHDRLDEAERFLWLNARLIDRLRFAHLFRDAPAEPVVTALRAYANPDGGYGHALEPDLRGPASQPVPAQHALDILHEAGADHGPAVARLCDHLAAITTPDGGVPFVLPSVREAPAAPWWQTPDDPPGALNPTASLAGRLHRARADHPWLGPATEFCWTKIDEMTDVPPYDAFALLALLDHAPDRERAEQTLERLRGPLLEHVALDPGAGGAVHFPLDYAPEPAGLGRRLFDDRTVERHLDALLDAQRDDGGWAVNFPHWTPVTEPEWRGLITVERLKTLRAYGRLA